MNRDIRDIDFKCVYDCNRVLSTGGRRVTPLSYALDTHRSKMRCLRYATKSEATHWPKLVAVAADPDPVSLYPAVTLWYSQHLVLVAHRPHPVAIYADQSLYHTLFGFERIPARVLCGGHGIGNSTSCARHRGRLRNSNAAPNNRQVLNTFAILNVWLTAVCARKLDLEGNGRAKLRSTYVLLQNTVLRMAKVSAKKPTRYEYWSTASSDVLYLPCKCIVET